jgi:2-phospho-L-lactate guanylyltransferase
VAVDSLRMIVAAVPVKDVANAKQRLMRVLDGPERRELARAMLVDVLRALAGAGLDRVWVVTREPEVAAIARSLGAEPMAEEDNRGHTAAVATAQAEAVRLGARAFLTIPGDVPCVTAAEIRTLLAALTAAPAAVFAPSRSGLGTNGALLAPPGVMRLRFGEPSFDNHLTAARGLGLTPVVVRLRGLGLDIDAPEDLVALLAEGAGTESRELLARFKLPQRLTGVRPAALG